MGGRQGGQETSAGRCLSIPEYAFMACGICCSRKTAYQWWEVRGVMAACHWWEVRGCDGKHATFWRQGGVMAHILLVGVKGVWWQACYRWVWGCDGGLSEVWICGLWS